MKLWVDDLRPAPDESWTIAKNSADAIEILSKAVPDVVSLDHDLGGDDTTRRVVLWFCENDTWPNVVHVHTANPVGRDWLVGMANRYGPGAR